MVQIIIAKNYWEILSYCHSHLKNIVKIASKSSLVNQKSIYLKLIRWVKTKIFPMNHLTGYTVLFFWSVHLSDLKITVLKESASISWYLTWLTPSCPKFICVIYGTTHNPGIQLSTRDSTSKVIKSNIMFLKCKCL